MRAIIIKASKKGLEEVIGVTCARLAGSQWFDVIAARHATSSKILKRLCGPGIIKSQMIAVIVTVIVSDSLENRKTIEPAAGSAALPYPSPAVYQSIFNLSSGCGPWQQHRDNFPKVV